ncbi:MAG: Rrf2 family transcriptional regulator [Saprospiraceae bacterium]|jgi:Rrf2 family protein|nr:Rrf2 family transcriptional regulator [Saprospiraceae bacterium]
MKISAQDEYGLRILLRLAENGNEEGLSIAQLSEVEGLSASYAAKLTRILRMAGLIQSTRGQKGGYILSKPADEISVKEVLYALDGTLYDPSFCDAHSGSVKFCTNSVDCSVRSLWKIVQISVDRVLEQVTLADLLSTEIDSTNALQQILEETTAYLYKTT